MKRTLIISIIVATVAFGSNAQERSGLLAKGEQSVGVYTGLDYSILPVTLKYSLGYNLFNMKQPVNSGFEMTVPVNSFDMNDIRLRLTTELTLLRKKNFEIRGGFSPVFVNVKMETETMSSLGMDFHAFTGLTNDRWNTGIEVFYNQMFSTHIVHTDKYKDNIFEAEDGWYKNTAANIRIGFLLNRRIKKFDINFRAGYSGTGEFNNYLFVPNMYSTLGLIFRF